MSGITPIQIIDAAIDNVNRIRTICQKQKTAQIKSKKELDDIKHIATNWLDNRSNIGFSPQESLQRVDFQFIEILEFSGHATTRKRYIDALNELKTSLISLKTEYMKVRVSQKGLIPPPDFSFVVKDLDMLSILNRRWNEVQFCLGANAHLSATVMMGGLLEAMILARILGTHQQNIVYTAKSVPKDKNNKNLGLKDWTLQDFINIAHEIKWISKSAKDVSIVLRDYRNFIHPNKELNYKININEDETKILWPVFVSLMQQLIDTAKKRK